MSRTKATLNKNDEVVLDITSLGFNGEGVARYGESGIVVFVKGALSGERVLGKIIKVNSDHCYARLMEIRKPSPHRVVPPCPVFSKCGGCALQHLSYEQQLVFKRQLVADSLKKYAKTEPIINPTVPSNPYRYRNKLAMPVGEIEGETVFGFYRERSHDIVPITDCLLQPNELETVVSSVKEYMQEYGLTPYNFTTKKGEIRHLVARQSPESIIVSIVTPRASLPHLKALYEVLKSRLQKAVGIYLNINEENNNVILGKKFVHFAGETHSTEDILGLEASVHPAGFLQVNREVCGLLYSALLNKLGTGYDVLIDAYSGGGTLTAALSKCAETTYAIEISGEATADAIAHAKKHNIGTITHIQGNCDSELPKLLNQVSAKNLAIVLDPPRKGCSKEVVEAVNNSRAKTVAYISCNPATLSRDIALLTNYIVEEVTPFDMFPQTGNVESLAVLRISANA